MIVYRYSRSQTIVRQGLKLLSLGVLLGIGFVLSGCRNAPEPGLAADVHPTATNVSAVPATVEATVPSPTPEPAATPIPAASPTPTLPPPADVFDQEPPAGVANYFLPLTVQHVTETGAVLLFELDRPVSGALYYRPVGGGPASARSVSLDASQVRHQIMLGDLQPGIEYQVQVGLMDVDETLRQPAFQESTWGAVHFQTASTEEPLRIGVLGDASFGDPATVTLVERMLQYDLDFTLHTGDVVVEIQNDPSPPAAYWLKYYSTLSGLLHRMPVYTVPGNHDYDQAGRWQERPFYYYAFPPFTDVNFPADGASGTRQYYAFTRMGIQFLMLDTQVFYGVDGWAEQDAWLDARLTDNRFRYTIPVFHVPPFFSGSVHPEDRLPVHQFWRPRFAAANVPVVFSGHSHHYERSLSDGTTYIVSGGGSGVTYAAGALLPESQVYARRTHFVLVEIFTGRIVLTAIDKDGEQLDQWTINR